MPEGGEITALLERVSRGEAVSEEAWVSAVYEPLRRLASAQLRRERPNHTIQPTALVHEAYLRLVHRDGLPLVDRTRFYAVAAGVMRRVLIDYARARNAAKRGGKMMPVELSDSLVVTERRGEELLALDEALTELAAFAPRLARIVELRFFGGLTVDETARELQLSPRQVKRDWKWARTWLRERLDGGYEE